MAIASTTIWECRSTGTATGGGGYSSGGTDYSVQDSPQLSVADAVANNTTTITSATGGFTAAMIGNVMYMAGGSGTLTATKRQITARASSTSITVDANIAAGTGITANVGGAVNDPGLALAFGTASNKYYIKQGTYTFAANPTINAANVAGPGTTAANWIEGYAVTRGDKPTGATRPTIQATSSCTKILPFTTQGWWVDNLILDCNNVANVGLEFTALYCDARDVKVMGFKQYGMNIHAFGGPRRCEITDGKTGSTAGINSSIGQAFISECYIHDNLCPGIVASAGPTQVDDCVIKANTGASSDGINSTYNLWASGNIIANNGRDGIQIVNGFTIGLKIKNNVITVNGRYGQNHASGAVPADSRFDGNAYYNNTTAARNNCGSGTLDQILTADPYVAVGTDYNSNTTAGGGMMLRGTGLPTFVPGLTTTSLYNDMGLRHRDTLGPVIGGGVISE